MFRVTLIQLAYLNALDDSQAVLCTSIPAITLSEEVIKMLVLGVDG